MAICKSCKSTNIIELDDLMTMNYRGSEYSVIMAYSMCNNCQREFVSKKQILVNDINVKMAIRSK